MFCRLYNKTKRVKYTMGDKIHITSIPRIAKGLISKYAWLILTLCIFKEEILLSTKKQKNSKR